ncbi:hypothetical protein COBT_001689 [Conglomerata obtusa]
MVKELIERESWGRYDLRIVLSGILNIADEDVFEEDKKQKNNFIINEVQNFDDDANLNSKQSLNKDVNDKQTKYEDLQKLFDTKKLDDEILGNKKDNAENDAKMETESNSDQKNYNSEDVNIKKSSDSNIEKEESSEKNTDSDEKKLTENPNDKNDLGQKKEKSKQENDSDTTHEKNEPGENNNINNDENKEVKSRKSNENDEAVIEKEIINDESESDKTSEKAASDDNKDSNDDIDKEIDSNKPDDFKETINKNYKDEKGVTEKRDFSKTREKDKSQEKNKNTEESDHDQKVDSKYSNQKNIQDNNKDTTDINHEAESKATNYESKNQKKTEKESDSNVMNESSAESSAHHKNEHDGNLSENLSDKTNEEKNSKNKESTKFDQIQNKTTDNDIEQESNDKLKKRELNQVSFPINKLKYNLKNKRNTKNQLKNDKKEKKNSLYANYAQNTYKTSKIDKQNNTFLNPLLKNMKKAYSDVKESAIKNVQNSCSLDKKVEDAIICNINFTDGMSTLKNGIENSMNSILDNETQNKLKSVGHKKIEFFRRQEVFELECDQKVLNCNRINFEEILCHNIYKRTTVYNLVIKKIFNMLNDANKNFKFISDQNICNRNIYNDLFKHEYKHVKNAVYKVGFNCNKATLNGSGNINRENNTFRYYQNKSDKKFKHYNFAEKIKHVNFLSKDYEKKLLQNIHIKKLAFYKSNFPSDDLDDLDYNNNTNFDKPNYINSDVLDSSLQALTQNQVFTGDNVDFDKIKEEKKAGEKLQKYADLLLKIKNDPKNQNSPFSNANLIIIYTLKKNISHIEGLTYRAGACSQNDTFSIIHVNDSDSVFYQAKVTAHEILHSMNASHNCDKNYLMDSQGCTTCREDDIRISNCTINEVVSYLDSQDEKCFKSDNLCGNGILDEGEECDSGMPFGSICCTEYCKLRKDAQCEDSNGKCCQDCKFVKKDTKCRESSDCEGESFCDGRTADCNINYREDGFKCKEGICKKGLCQTRDLLCNRIGKVYSDTCEQAFGCQLVCKNENDICSLIGAITNMQTKLINVLDDMPCIIDEKNGVCLQGQCVIKRKVNYTTALICVGVVTTFVSGILIIFYYKSQENNLNHNN